MSHLQFKHHLNVSRGRVVHLPNLSDSIAQLLTLQAKHKVNQPVREQFVQPAARSMERVLAVERVQPAMKPLRPPPRQRSKR